MRDRRRNAPSWDSAIDRRRFLIGGAATAALSAALPRKAFAAAPRIVIIGAGCAGVRCADLLHRQGVRSTIYEAAGRVGGRTFSGVLGGLVIEHGGEMIGKGHRAVRRLAADLGLDLEVANGGELLRGDEVYLIGAERYASRLANQDYGAVFPLIRRAMGAAPWPQLWNRHSPTGRRLDHMSADEWVERHVSGGTSSRLGKLILSQLISEYGGEPAEQSALNVVYLYGWDGPKPFGGGGNEDEYFHVKGGNQQLVTEMVDRLSAGTVKTGHALVALRRNGNGTTTCTFQSGARTLDVVADRVVLALPFRTLREVDLSGAELSPRKLRAIRRLGMGTNAKLHLHLRHRTWGPNAKDPATRGLDGVAYTAPDGFQTVWDGAVSHGPDTILVRFTGGRIGASYRGPPFGPGPGQDVRRFLRHVDRAFPGTSDAYDGRSSRSVWARDPWHRGSYSFWRVGQYTDLAGYERVPEHAIHFCGEHTSVEFQGYIEGAIRSGERAAREILSSL